MNIAPVNPLDYPNWDKLILSTPAHSFFHSASWARVINNTYDYKPVYFLAADEDRLSTLIPFMEVDSWITGRRGVSLPFTDFCEPIFDPIDQYHTVLDYLKQYAKNERWDYLEFRGGEKAFTGFPQSSVFMTHELNLSRSESDFAKSLRSSTYRNIKKSIKNGISVTISSSHSAVKEFYRLHCMTRKKYRVPPQPFSFFENIYAYIMKQGHGFVSLARLKNTIVAGAVFFCFGRRAYYKYAASDMNFSQYRPSNLVMWESILWLVKNNFELLEFGRTECENVGLLQFKRGWRPTETTRPYYRYDMKKNNFISRQENRDGWTVSLAHILPFPVLRVAGAHLYKHMG